MPRLGLLDASPSRWANLAAHVAGLNAQAGPDTSFKLVFVQRHGEGWHNVAETFYGHGSAVRPPVCGRPYCAPLVDPADRPSPPSSRASPSQRWCDEYARRYFADGMVWGPDPELTPAGLEQASDVARAWAAEVRDGGAAAVLPKVLWASPLKRAAMCVALLLTGLSPCGMTVLTRPCVADVAGRQDARHLVRRRAAVVVRRSAARHQGGASPWSRSSALLKSS